MCQILFNLHRDIQIFTDGSLDMLRDVPGCQLLVLALVQSAAGFGCGSGS